ncbi:MAG: choice-of-anchor L domain-containing protein [Acidobacteriota bacterium]
MSTRRILPALLVVIAACGPSVNHGGGGGGGGGDGGSNVNPDDPDGDGFTAAQGDCCQDASQCSNPELVNPGAFDVPGNNVDDDCDGKVDESEGPCDTGLASNSSDPMDYAKAIDLCQTTTMADRTWGVLEAKLLLADGTGTPDGKQHSIRPAFGSTTVQGGMSFAVLSSGVAAATGQTNPSPVAFDPGYQPGTASNFPQDWYAANNNTLPNAPGCPAANPLAGANDPVMLQLKVRVPTNASSFKLSVNFMSSEFPEYVCTPFNDFFVVLLDSSYAGTPANPADKNLAFYTSPSMMNYPVGVNLANGNTGLFQECKNGPTGCDGLNAGTIMTCKGTGELAGTGMDKAQGGCASGDLMGGGTGWLVTSGNVVGGEIITLRIAIWDTSDEMLDSLAIIDNFQWQLGASQPGTVIQ